MTEVVRLALVSHAMTDAMAAGRFPADEPLNVLGHRQASSLTDLGTFDSALCAPETRARQTADVLGLDVENAPELTDLDCGGWRGSALDDLATADLAVWLTDPSQAPHGGESVAELIDRVGGWLDTLTAGSGRVVAVTHPGVIRAAIVAALDAPPTAFWRIDIGPVSRTVMHRRGRAWTLRATGTHFA